MITETLSPVNTNFTAKDEDINWRIVFDQTVDIHQRIISDLLAIIQLVSRSRAEFICPTEAQIIKMRLTLAIQAYLLIIKPLCQQDSHHVKWIKLVDEFNATLLLLDEATQQPLMIRRQILLTRINQHLHSGIFEIPLDLILDQISGDESVSKDTHVFWPL
ncbi:MAG: hypothetical protein ACFBSC_12925 [Microcoleaceae cyanobacterium]